MQVIRARSAGFCIGVSLALRRLDQELESLEKNRDGSAHGHSGRLFTLGSIIHNPLVIQGYEARGVHCQEDPERFRPGDRAVIRAHGVPPDIEQRLEELGVSVIDATCPKVKRAQLAIGKEQKKGGRLLLFGEKDHPEVRGLLGYAGKDALVFGNLEELERLSITPGPAYFLAAQTTQDRSIFQEARTYVESRLDRTVTCLDTICDATRDRQREVRELAGQVEAMVVVGGFASGNTKRLAEVARSENVPAMHVEQTSDITPELFREILYGRNVVGLTAGASTPEEHIDAMQTYLEGLTY